MVTSLVDNPTAAIPVEAAPDPQVGRARTRLIMRALAGTPGLAQVWFDATVLDRYRGAPGYSIMRTDTVGRVRCGSWRLDFGIAHPGQFGSGAPLTIHASIGDLADRLPEAERAHWAAHAVMPGASTNFLLMQATHGACIDDGDTRSW